MPTLIRILTCTLLVASPAAALAATDDGRDDPGRAATPELIVSVVTRAALRGPHPEAGSRIRFSLAPVQPALQAAPEGRKRFRFQLRGVLVADDRLEFGGRWQSGPYLRPGLVSARFESPGLDTKATHAPRLRMAYYAGPWSLALGATPGQRAGGAQARLNYTVRF